LSPPTTYLPDAPDAGPLAASTTRILQPHTDRRGGALARVMMDGWPPDSGWVGGSMAPPHRRRPPPQSSHRLPSHGRAMSRYDVLLGMSQAPAAAACCWTAGPIENALPMLFWCPLPQAGVPVATLSVPLGASRCPDALSVPLPPASPSHKQVCRPRKPVATENVWLCPGQ
jgi:hypothetical protein